MRGLGIAVLVSGVLVIIGALLMDVSVSSGIGRVNNLGLMAERQNFTMIGGILLLAGLLMAIFGRRPQASVAQAELGSRPCPMCAEAIKNAAVKCRHCGSDVQPVATARLAEGWVASIPCKEGPEQARTVEAIESLGFPAVPMEGANIGAGPFFTKEEAKHAARRLADERKLFANVDYRDRASGKFPPLPE